MSDGDGHGATSEPQTQIPHGGVTAPRRDDPGHRPDAQLRG
ncbi:hypothetical protein BN2537_595 [Streptomyces venezuelae]|nr:hypothetical protein BN2537_595 [Streptomyces venezuelae]